VGAALAQGDHPDLGQRAGGGVVARAVELGVVVGGGRHVKDQTVEGHQAQSVTPRPAGTGTGHRHRDPLTQQL
jgi:hypothetical protein